MVRSFDEAGYFETRVILMIIALAITIISLCLLAQRSFLRL